MELSEVGVRVEIYRLGSQENKDPTKSIFQALLYDEQRGVGS